MQFYKQEFCFGVLNEIKDQIIQRKTPIRGIEVSLNYHFIIRSLFIIG